MDQNGQQQFRSCGLIFFIIGLVILMRRFAGLSIDEGFIPDESPILKFPHFLGERDMTGETLSVMDEHLADEGWRLLTGTIVAATIINSLVSTKNAKKERVPELKSTNRGNQWHFGVKIRCAPTRKGSSFTKCGYGCPLSF